MEEKIMSFMQFCEVVENELIQAMPEAYHNGKYSVTIAEEKDSYGQVSTWFYLENTAQLLEDLPKFSLDGAYENYKKMNADKDKIIGAIAERYDAQYSAALRKANEKCDGILGFDAHRLFIKYVTYSEAEVDSKEGFMVKRQGDDYVELHALLSYGEWEYKSSKITVAQIKDSGADEAELYQVAKSNVPRILPLQAHKLPRNTQDNAAEAYYVVMPEGSRWELYGNDVFDGLSADLGKDLLVLSVSEKVKLVVAAESVQVLEDINKIMEEMSASGYRFLDGNVSLFENREKRFTYDRAEIEKTIGKKEQQSRSIFNR